MRFYDPKSGSIKINGETLPNINTRSLRDNMAYITQQTYIFNETIEENIRLARRDATLEEITYLNTRTLSALVDTTKQLSTKDIAHLNAQLDSMALWSV